MKVSIVIPCYNERSTIGEIIARVRECFPASAEVIVVDDGSTDCGIESIYDHLLGQVDVVIRHSSNQGKGAALRSALRVATGDVLVIQDADLEYDPRDLSAVIAPILANDADLVFGSRFLSKNDRGFWINRCYNVFASYLISQLMGRALTDYATGYKAARTTMLRTLALRFDGFAVDAEITIKAMNRPELRLREVPISYRPRGHEEGKKIRWWHGIESLAAILGLALRVRVGRALDV